MYPKEASVPGWLIFILIVFAITIVILSLVINHIQRNRRQENKRHKDEMEKLEKEFSDFLTAFCTSIAIKYGNSFLYEICGAPPNTKVKEGFPYKRDIRARLKYGNPYTFFLATPWILKSHENRSFHYEHCRIIKHAHSPQQINAVVAKETSHLYPCQICKPTLPDLRWLYEYNYYYSILKKYDKLLRRHNEEIYEPDPNERFCGTFMMSQEEKDSFPK